MGVGMFKAPACRVGAGASKNGGEAANFLRVFRNFGTSVCSVCIYIIGYADKYMSTRSTCLVTSDIKL